MGSSNQHAMLTLHQIMRNAADEDLACADTDGLLNIANSLEGLAVEIIATVQRLRNRCCIQ